MRNQYDSISNIQVIPYIVGTLSSLPKVLVINAFFVNYTNIIIHLTLHFKGLRDSDLYPVIAELLRVVPVAAPLLLIMRGKLIELGHARFSLLPLLIPTNCMQDLDFSRTTNDVE